LYQQYKQLDVLTRSKTTITICTIIRREAKGVSSRLFFRRSAETAGREDDGWFTKVAKRSRKTKDLASIFIHVERNSKSSSPLW